MARLRLALAGLLVAAAVLLVVWATSSGGPPANAGATPAGSTGKPSAPTDAPREVQGSNPDRAAIEHVLVVVDEQSGAPLAGGSVTALPRSTTQLTLDAEPIAVAGADGRIVWTSLAPADHVLLVRAARHLPRTIDAPSSGETRVGLLPCATLELGVVDTDGVPVESALGMLTKVPWSDFSLAPGAAPIGIGHPMASHPRWCSLTGSEGRMVLDEIPPGRAWLNVIGNTVVPLDETAANGALDLPPGITQLTVVVAEMHAAVFLLPSRSAIRQVTWNVDTKRLSTEPRVVSRLGVVRQHVERRFPQSLVYAHQPRPNHDVPVGCLVVCEDGTMWRGSWELTPLRDITDPVYLEQEQGPLRSVIVDLVDPDGRSYPGVPIAFRSRPEGVTTYGATGEPVLLPHGTYKVNPRQGEQVIYLALQGCVITVDGASPERVKVDLERPLAEVVVTVEYPSEHVLSVLEVDLSNEVGEGPHVVNYRPDRGPIHYRLHGETVTVKVRSVGYEDVDFPTTKLDFEAPTRFHVVLKEKVRK